MPDIFEKTPPMRAGTDGGPSGCVAAGAADAWLPVAGASKDWKGDNVDSS